MDNLMTTIEIIVGKNAVVTMPTSGCILITHSSGKHWFRIYPDVSPNSDRVFLLDDQGGCQAVAQLKWAIIESLTKLFGPRT
jgi:hypothetical protein